MCVCLLDSIVGQYLSCRQYIKAISHTQTNMDAHKHTVHAHRQEHILSSPTLPKLTHKKRGLDGFGSVTITQDQEGEKSVQQL